MNGTENTFETISPGMLRRYIDGQTSEEENKLIFDWLQQDGDNPRYLSEMLANISVHDTLTDPSLDDRLDRMLSRLDARIAADEDNSPSHRLGIIRRIAFAAVSCAATLAFVLVFNRVPEKETVEVSPSYRYRVANTTPYTRTVILGDNTKVYLKPGSELRYDVTELPDSRIVSLEGEAYFDVARDTLKPFTVRTRNIDVKVLGTAFCVRSSTDNPDTEVLLERGEVRVFSPDGVALVNMKPDQKVTYDSASGVVSMESVKALPYIAETYNLVTMENATIGEILLALQQNYGLEVTSSKSISDEKYNFNYMKTDSLEDVISILEFISGNKYTIHY